MARVLILGGVGFVGRNLVQYLVSNNLVSKICVADKVLPEVAGLSESELAVFKGDKVTFKQCNLARDAMVEKVFAHDGGNWEFVFNLAAATKYSQAWEVYKENIIDVAQVTATHAAKNKCKRFIHVSTAQVYDAGQKPRGEDAKIKPWTQLAKASVEAEDAVKATAGLNFVIVRPAIIYGPGDSNGITPRIIVGAVYKKLGEKMEMLWTKDLKLNTVHVRDVCRALWFLTSKGNSGDVYNLADSGDSDQGSVSALVSQLFGIKSDFMGAMMSKVATSLAMKAVADEANDKHLKPWSDLCKEHKIVDTPLTPYLDEELLYNNSTSVDGTKITGLGFKYDFPQMTVDLLKEIVRDYEAKKFFPAGITV